MANKRAYFTGGVADGKMIRSDYLNDDPAMLILRVEVAGILLFEEHYGKLGTDSTGALMYRVMDRIGSHEPPRQS